MKFCDRASGLGGPDKEKGPFVIGEGLTRKRHMFVSCARADSYFSSDKKRRRTSTIIKKNERRNCWEEGERIKRIACYGRTGKTLS